MAHLAVACDGYHNPEETREAPVPAGLDALSDAQRALVELYGLGDDLIAAAAQQSPSMPSRVGTVKDYSKWLREQSEAAKNAWLGKLMADPSSAVRAEILAKYRAACSLPTWPTTRSNRTIAQLHAAADDIASVARRKVGEKAARQRTKCLAAMAADPMSTLRETERLVTERTTQAYRKLAKCWPTSARRCRPAVNRTWRRNRRRN